MRTARLSAHVVLATVLLGGGLAGCSSEGAAEEQSPTDVLAAARTALDETPGVRLTLATDKLPDGVDGVLQASGVGTHAPAFEGDITVSVNSLSVDVPVVAVDGKVFAKLPFTTEFAEIDPGDYGAPDPAALLDTEAGISAWLTEAADVTEGDQVRDGEQVLTSYDGTVPGDAVVAVIPSADETGEFPATFQVDDDGRLVAADISGPFYGATGVVDYRLSLADYGTEQDITAP